MVEEFADEAAADRRLKSQGADIEALVAKANFRTAAGDERGAAAFYRAALNAAARAQPLSASLRPAIEMAQAGIARADRVFREHQEQALADAGFPQGRRPPRFQSALDILNGMGGADLRLQRPTSFYFPGLPQRCFYEAQEFPWAAELEAATGTIRGELESELIRGGEGFAPYLVADPDRPRTEFHGLHDNPRWSVLQLFERGEPTAASERFPATMAAIRKTDLTQIGVRAPNVLFSRLAAGATIPPHHGMINARLICHLPLIVPPNCQFRVGPEVRTWREGQLLIFDDSIEHEARNDSAEDRIVLIFDVWRPELSDDERSVISAMFAAIDSF